MLAQTCTTSATLEVVTGYTRGERDYASIDAKVAVIDITGSDLAIFGKLRAEKVILMLPPSTPPSLPCRVTAEGKTYDIQRIHECRNIFGKIIGYRMAAANV